MDQDNDYSQMEAGLARWAEQQAEVRAVLVIGSRARADHPCDAWSDLDTIAFVDDDSSYKTLGAWSDTLADALGKTTWFSTQDWLTEHVFEWETVFADGSKLDIVFSPNRSPQGAAAALAQRLEQFPFRNVLRNGMRMLVDKTNSPVVTLDPPDAPTLPDGLAFTNAVHCVLLEMFRAWKLAGRSELWRAARAVNEEMQAALLPLIGWHAQAAHGRSPWAYGRFLEEWADPNVLALLEGTYARNTRESVLRALLNAQRLLALLAVETSEKTGLPYPQQAVEKMGAWLE